MKPKQPQNSQQQGFTLIELLVVISIMILITGLLVMDFNSHRLARSIVIAKNETATNLRKVQAYLLSSRNISTNVPAKFYIVKFTKSNSYTVQAVDNQYVFHDNLENITLPNGVTISTLQNGNASNLECMQVIYGAPFGIIYIYGSTNPAGCDSSIAATLHDPVQIAGLSQSTSYVVFQGTVGDPAGKYVQISPLSGQILSH